MKPLEYCGKKKFVEIGRTWTRSHKIGRDWTRLDEIGQARTKFDECGRVGRDWTRLDKLGQDWTSGRDWTRLDESGPIPSEDASFKTDCKEHWNQKLAGAQDQCIQTARQTNNQLVL